MINLTNPTGKKEVGRSKEASGIVSGQYIAAKTKIEVYHRFTFCDQNLLIVILSA